MKLLAVALALDPGRTALRVELDTRPARSSLLQAAETPGDWVAPAGSLASATDISGSHGNLFVAEKADLVVAADIDEPIHIKFGAREVSGWPYRETYAGTNGTTHTWTGVNFTIAKPLAVAVMLSHEPELGQNEMTTNVFVAEATRVTRWINKIPEENSGFGKKPPMPDPAFVLGNVNNPFALATTKNGRLFVSDTGNNRVLEVKVPDFQDAINIDSGYRKAEKGDPDVSADYPTVEKLDHRSLLERAARLRTSATDPTILGQDEEQDDTESEEDKEQDAADLAKAQRDANPVGMAPLYINAIPADLASPMVLAAVPVGVGVLVNPRGIAVRMVTHRSKRADGDELFQLYVADSHHRVLKFENQDGPSPHRADPNGVQTQSWGAVGTVVAGSCVGAADQKCTAGSDHKSLDTPSGIVVRDHWVFIADTNNDRVLMWEVGQLEGIVVASMKRPQKVVLMNQRIIVLDEEGSIKMWSVPCPAPPVVGAVTPSCEGTSVGLAGARYLVGVGHACKPACKESFEQQSSPVDTRLVCDGRPLQFACKLTDRPHGVVTQLSYTDTDPDWHALGGTVTWKWPSELSAVSGAAVYLQKEGDPERTLLGYVNKEAEPQWTFDEIGGSKAGCTHGEIWVYLQNRDDAGNVHLGDHAAVFPYEELVTGGWKTVDGMSASDTSKVICPKTTGVRVTAVSPGAPMLNSCEETDDEPGLDVPDHCWGKEDKGKYFFFDKQKLQSVLGREVKSKDILRLKLLRNDVTVGVGQVQVSCEADRIPAAVQGVWPALAGDCSGQLYPEWASEPDQWRQFDILVPPSFRATSVNKKGCYNPDAACCEGTATCWPYANKFVWFNKAEAEEALGTVLAADDTVVGVRQLRLGAAVWEGKILVMCRRPLEDDSPEFLVGDCHARKEPEELYPNPNGGDSFKEGDRFQPVDAGDAITSTEVTVTVNGTNETKIVEDKHGLMSLAEQVQVGNLRDRLRVEAPIAGAP